jgi:hypothetical protein
MTVPPPKTKGPDQRASGAAPAVESLAGPDEVAVIFECPDLDLPTDDEHAALVRKTVLELNPWLHFGPQPLSLILDLLECNLEVDSGCARRLFWLAHEKGYLSLHEGNVYLGRLRAEI